VESLILSQWHSSPAEGMRTPLPAEINPDARASGQNAVHECDAAANTAADNKTQGKILIATQDFRFCCNAGTGWQCRFLHRGTVIPRRTERRRKEGEEDAERRGSTRVSLLVLDRWVALGWGKRCFIQQSHSLCRRVVLRGAEPLFSRPLERPPLLSGLAGTTRWCRREES
jgi:hypothetical protein